MFEPVFVGRPVAGLLLVGCPIGRVVELTTELNWLNLDPGSQGGVII